MKNKISPWLKEHEALLITRSNAYQSEYVRPHEEHLSYITGFNGSAGCALIGKDSVALFVDGRYTLQAKSESPDFEICSHRDFFLWMENNKIQKILFDPMRHTLSEVKSWQKKSIAFQESDIINQIWKSPPLCIHKPPYIYKEPRIWHYDTPTFLTDPESVNWLLGIRGFDIPYTPVAYAYAVVFEGHIDVFQEHDYQLDIPFVKWHKMDDLPDYLLTQERLCVDPRSIPYGLSLYLKNPIFVSDPSCLERACKTKEEQDGMRKAHQIDAIAMHKFLKWIQDQKETTEVEAQEKLESFRREHSAYQGPSFPTISGVDEHGAIVHYRATKASDKKITPPCLYLVDSGGQYFEGTTDITRTIAFGEPAQEQKEMYTRVLKGHIALAMARFPKGTTGHQLDGFARQYLWQIGKDYTHGTGHGVGTFLSVHEGPQGISSYPNPIPLMPGMVVSNEPGFYKENEYGIRIENLMMVVESQDDFLEFEMLTFVELDEKLILNDLITQDEKKWIRWYQEKCLNNMIIY